MFNRVVQSRPFGLHLTFIVFHLSIHLRNRGRHGMLSNISSTLIE